MNVAFAVAALLALTAAGIHSVIGERRVLSKLAGEGGPQVSQLGSNGRRLIRVTWHLLSVAFLAGGVALAVQAFGPPDGSARAVGRTVALPFFGFTLLILLWAIRAPGALRHPAWLAFLATAALAWWGGS